jgi:beta-mannosidase
MPVAGRRRVSLIDGWTVGRSAAGEFASPADTDGLSWTPAHVPGTVADALGEAAAGLDLDAYDWWFRLAFDAEPAAAGEQVVLALDGVATVCEVFLNGSRVLASESMFAAHELDVGALLRGAGNELSICCRALAPLLAGRRKPRARWRTKLVSSANLRFYRTMLLGRAPGFAPGPAAVGPWRPVSLERRSGVLAERVRVRTGFGPGGGSAALQASLRALPGAELPGEVEIVVAGRSVVLPVGVAGVAGAVRGAVSVPDAEPWWPHTHGTPALHELSLVDPVGDALHRAHVGFRSLSLAGELLADGPALSINGESVFCRGAVWTPLSPGAATSGALREVLETVAGGGMNMVRIPGIGAYEDVLFHDLCDELGILVWQDFMFANLDYPESDAAFMEAVEAEARTVLERLGPRPSTAVLCGGSEVAQQVAMLGLDPALASGPLYGQLLPRLVREASVDAPYVESAPWGGELPFRTDRGVANYYGVGAYLRPLEDARRAEVRFAAECLAFANVPDDDALPATVVHDPAWKAGVPRDMGAGWDFDDVRDHYLKLLFDVDPAALRYSDPERYLELSRTVSGEVMAETFGEWRRAASPCGGALVLWLRDLAPGAGWGVLDDRGRPKVAYHWLRRALAPVAVWGTDEGLGGITAHVANDRAAGFDGTLRVALYRDLATVVEQASTAVALGPHGYSSFDIEGLIGRFVDVGWAYRFGPPAQDLVALTLSDEDGNIVSQAFRFPAGRPVRRLSPDELGLSASVSGDPDGGRRVTVSSRRFAYGVRVHVPGWEPSDDAFGVEPGGERVLALRPAGAAGAGAVGAVGAVVGAAGAVGAVGGAAGAGGQAASAPVPPSGSLTALNLTGSVRLQQS